MGYDSHRFTAGRPLVLGGVVIPHTLGLKGHSDADAICHALTDAILGAAAMGNIGEMFPDTDPAWQDANSTMLLRRAVDRVDAAGWVVNQCDITVIAEAPKIGPHVAAIRERIADVLGTAVASVSVKGKTNEGMGWIGAGEGIAVIAVATLTARH